MSVAGEAIAQDEVAVAAGALVVERRRVASRVRRPTRSSDRGATATSIAWIGMPAATRDAELERVGSAPALRAGTALAMNLSCLAVASRVALA